MAAAIIGGTGLSMVKAHEGLRLKPYIDPVGILTVCYGHTGPDVKPGQSYTKAQCDSILLQDLSKHRKEVEGCVSAPLTPNQRDAVVVFTFNVGGTRFCRSTMARKLNARDYIGAADEFPKWENGTFSKPQPGLKCRPHKKVFLCVLPGLVKRRTDERNLFLTQYRNPSVRASWEAQRAILIKEVNR